MPYYGYCRDKKGRRSGPDAARILDTMVKFIYNFYKKII